MQEKANPVRYAQRPKLRCQRDHVVVVHPDHVIRTQQRQKPLRELTVDGPVAVIIIGFEINETKSEMQ